LCVIKKGTKQTCSARFFSELSHQDTYTIYRHVLELLTTQTTSAISLNTSLDFLKAHYVEMLSSEFVDVKLILELLETSPLHSIIQIEERLHEFKEHPRVSIWLDDFGTERSNFDLVNKINFDAVKMSKELFWDLYENDKILLKYLMKMIKRKANMMVVEGVDRLTSIFFVKNSSV
jgi:EAL domain-containing protein (putative c-di-GMP-specific phosphodiesterase class I)